MDKEESWQQFWSSGKVEDYLSYSMCEKAEDVKQDCTQEDMDFSKRSKDYFM